MGLNMRENREKCMFDSMCYPHNQELVLFEYHTGGGGGTPSKGCSYLPRSALKKGENDLEKILSPESKIGPRHATLRSI